MRLASGFAARANHAQAGLLGRLGARPRGKWGLLAGTQAQGSARLASWLLSPCCLREAGKQPQFGALHRRGRALRAAALGLGVIPPVVSASGRKGWWSWVAASLQSRAAAIILRRRLGGGVPSSHVGWY